MNGPFQTARELTASPLPVEFEVLAPPPLLLPGEHLDHYQTLRQAIFADLAPRSAIEWLLAIDVADCRGRSSATACCATSCLRPIAKRRLKPPYGGST
jgi:hypothetical protein